MVSLKKREKDVESLHNVFNEVVCLHSSINVANDKILTFSESFWGFASKT